MIAPFAEIGPAFAGAPMFTSNESEVRAFLLAGAGFTKALSHLVDERLGNFRGLGMATQDFTERDDPAIEVLSRIIVLPHFCAAQFHARKQPLGSRVTEHLRAPLPVSTGC